MICTYIIIIKSVKHAYVGNPVNLIQEMKLQKSMFAKKAKSLYMNGEDEEMAALMPDFYAGKFKKSYNAAPWAKAKN